MNQNEALKRVMDLTKPNIDELLEALREIAEMKDKTLLGCHHEEHRGQCEGREPYSLGANRAFNQCASIALRVLPKEVA